MKKIIILIAISFCLTGCFDYKEINNLAFASAIGIDYQNDEYTVSLEILNDKVDKNSMKITSYIKTGKDKSLAVAIEKAANQISNQVNYSHVKLMVLSNSVIKEKLETLSDFFLRSTYFRENFFVVSSLNNEPEKVLKTTTDENPIASIAITELLEGNNYASNSAILKTFDKIIEEILTFGKDTCFSNIDIVDDSFIIDGMILFKDYNYSSRLENEDATLYNILTDNFYKPVFSNDYNNQYFSIAVATGKIEVELSDRKINVLGNITGKIIDNEPNFDIKSTDVLKNINDDFTDILNTKIRNFLIKLQNVESDILGISQKYYQKNREKNKELWKNADINIDLNFTINKKGLIYEVQNEK